jgi:hypothetical protein
MWLLVSLVKKKLDGNEDQLIIGLVHWALEANTRDESSEIQF